MDDIYLINDKRLYEDFKIKTFSGFKKTDVINAVFKCIEGKKIEQACFWTTECICSGYSNVLWEKLILYSSKVIHINNPLLPFYIMKKNNIYFNQIKCFPKKSNENYILLRNSQMIRNLFFDVVTTLSISLKTKKYDKYSKIKPEEDFKIENIKKRFCAQMNILPNNILHFNDPDELRVILNEIFTMIKNKQFGYDRCCFWILWLIKWELQHKKNNTPWIISERNMKGVDKKYSSNIIWIIWDIIFKEMEIRNNDSINKQINSLYEIFIREYTHGKRNKRLPIIFNAVGYLTHNINFNIPIRNNIKIFIQVQANVNKMFFNIKKHEVKVEKEVVKKLKKNQDETVEIQEDKINLFNEIDKHIMN